MSEERYGTESDLCQVLMERASMDGWVPYPEIEDWDVVLVRGGIQVGIQAKLRFNTKVVSQALRGLPGIDENQRRHRGPHYRAIAIPLKKTSADDAYRVGRMCRLLVIDMHRSPDLGFFAGWRHVTRDPLQWRNARVNWRYYRWRPDETLWIPPAVPDIPAGVQSPRTVGRWQIAACWMEMQYRERGYVSLVDAREAIKLFEGDWRPHTMLARYWQCIGKQDGRAGAQRCRKWHMNSWQRENPPSVQYPEAWAMIGEES